MLIWTNLTLAVSAHAVTDNSSILSNADFI